MKIDEIKDISLKCTGCLACVDACPTKSISKYIGKDGFCYTKIEKEKCVDCDRCYSVCPLIKKQANNSEQKLYACYAKDKEKLNGGSSGGIFELLATYCINNGYYVCGAAFNDSLQLKHKIVNNVSDLVPLLKSKYIQSDTLGIYTQISELLKKGEKVFFCGTPCQVSGLKNIVNIKYLDNLFTADIICHGVPSQKTFDNYVKTLEEKHNKAVVDFKFRVKDNKFKHAHGYMYKIQDSNKVFNGIYTESTYYNAFKNYLMFRESCYDCNYATLNRVSDITLGDFWGIEKYGFKGNTDKGVSMIITNTKKGATIFEEIKDFINKKEFPLQYGIDSNHCLTKSTQKPKKRDEIIESLTQNGYASTAEKYFKSGIKHKIYWLVPPTLRNLIRRIR